MAEVQLQHLTRRYPGAAQPALSDVFLDIQPGEFVVLVGPSGCGKSTALRLIAGLDEPDDGEVWIGGRPMRGVPPQDRNVAMVFQSYALYPHMRVRDILGFPLKMQGVVKAERARRVLEAARLLSIDTLLERRPHELSGGERQRVAMGRALVRKPAVFLFDEPLSNLDAALRSDIRLEIGSLVRKVQATTVYVTHDHVEAMTLGDRIAVMRGGRIEQTGGPRELYEKPATAFVAGFLGAPPMNLLPTTREGDVLSAGGLRVRLPASRIDPCDECLLGVRPEHVHLGPASSPAAVTADAWVRAVEPLGAETHVHLDVSGVAMRARVPGLDVPPRSQRVPIWFASDQTHLFRAQGAQKRVDVALGAP